MADNLTAYPAYTPTTSDFVGAYPSHWAVQRAKVLFRQVDERSEAGIEELLSVSHKTGVTPRSEKNVSMFLAESNAGHKVCRPGDIVVNTMWAWMAAVGVSKDTGLVSPSYAVYRPRKMGQLSDRFVDELLRTPNYRNEFLVRSTGITPSRLRLYPDEFLRIPLPIPPSLEQEAVVHFLDHADRRIGRYVRVKLKLIKLLVEQRQAIIDDAVSQAIAQNVSSEPTGVELVGSVPRIFRRTKLRRLCTSIRDGTHNPPPVVSGAYRLLSVRNIQNDCFATREDDRTMSEGAFAELQRSYTVEEGDVVLALVGATTGKSAVVGPLHNVSVQRSVGVLRPNRELLDSRYLQYVISSSLVQDQIREIMKKYAAQPGIYLDDVSNLQIVYPDLEAQQQIADLISRRIREVDLARANCGRLITLVREYRTRLIADVITGKLDVRAAAAALPQGADEQTGADNEGDIEDLVSELAEDVGEPELEEVEA
jgi:type I restriction enzyme S subunit